MSNFVKKLRRVKIKQILSAWKLPVALIAAPFYKLKHKDLWIICDSENEARDNGYWLFKYIRECHPEQDCVFAIYRKSFDFLKVEKLGNTVEYGSLKHWIMYLASTKKMSSQKAGNPNAAIFYFLEVYGLLKDKRIFLQHGITINDGKWLYYDVTKMYRFLCGASPEYDFIEDKFGYPKGNVVYTGFARFDNLYDNAVKREILIMPTWREWIADEDHRLAEIEGTTEIPKTNYFVKWNAFLASPKLKEIADKYNVTFIFFPHRNMQKYMEFFQKSTSYLKVLSGKDIDIQKLLKESCLMITDYSSVFFDFVYMKKPVIFYQFDYTQFRANQYSEGYFNYNDNPFAVSCADEKQVFQEIENSIKADFAVNERFLSEHERYFPLYDKQNCQRVYELIKNS